MVGRSSRSNLEERPETGGQMKEAVKINKGKEGKKSKEEREKKEGQKEEEKNKQ